MRGNDFSFSVHDAFRVELACNYHFSSGRGVPRYRIETWFFLPRPLGIHEGSYGRERFYAGLQHYLRLKTPPVSLADFVTDADPVFRDWKDCLERGLRDRMVNATRMLGNVFKSACRDETEKDPLRFVRLLRAASRRFKAFSVEAERFFVRAACGPEVRAAYDRTDEYVSLLTEKACFQFLEQLGWKPSAGRKEFFRLVAEEAAWRRKRGYPDEAAARRNPEDFLLRFSRLKKEIAGSLFLHVWRFDRSRFADNAVIGLSAALAMLVFTMVSYFANWRFAPFSVPFLLLIIAGYVFKDRLKDFLKFYVKSRFLRTAFDNEIVIRGPDPAGSPMGGLKESVYFTDARQAPVGPEDLAPSDLSPFLGDTVLCYVREVTLFASRLRRAYPLFGAVRDIVRWNINELLVRMDDPEASFWKLEGQKVRRVRTLRVYPVTVVVRVRQGREVVALRRYRLDLNRRGIVRFTDLPA